MSIEQNKTVLRRVFAALNDRDLDNVVTLYSPDCCFHGWGPETLDVAGYKAAMTAVLDAFPDSHFEPGDFIAEGDRVVVPHSLKGTHQAEFQGIPATGRSIAIDAVLVARLENGRAAELWLNADLLGLMQQLGAIPTATVHQEKS